MAVVSKDNPANLTASVTVAAQVEERIAAVNRAYDKAVDALSGGFFGQSDTERSATHNVKQFRDDVDAWAKRGRGYVKAGTKPPNGWSSWFEVGRAYIEGFHVQAEFDHETLRAFVDTVKEAPATTAKAVVKAAKAVETAGANVAMGILKPVAVALGVYLLVVTLVRRA